MGNVTLIYPWPIRLSPFVTHLLWTPDVSEGSQAKDNHFLRTMVSHTDESSISESETKVPLQVQEVVMKEHAHPNTNERTRQTRRREVQSGFKSGKWSREERLLFLKGFRVHGYGKWKLIGRDYLPSRYVHRLFGSHFL